MHAAIVMRRRWADRRVRQLYIRGWLPILEEIGQLDYHLAGK